MEEGEEPCHGWVVRSLAPGFGAAVGRCCRPAAVRSIFHQAVSLRVASSGNKSSSCSILCNLLSSSHVSLMLFLRIFANCGLLKNRKENVEDVANFSSKVWP